MTRNRHFETAAGRRESETWNLTIIPRRVMDRAYAKTTRSATGCWISGYSVGSHGYAQIGWKNAGSRHMVLAHRAVWERLNGPVPVGVTLDHTCKTKRCVNPAHLRILSNFENARRGGRSDWQLGECANGHPNSLLIDLEMDLRWNGNRSTRRRCSECRKFYARRYAWRTRRAGEPLPDHLLLESERREIGRAA